MPGRNSNRLIDHSSPPENSPSFNNPWWNDLVHVEHNIFRLHGTRIGLTSPSDWDGDAARVIVPVTSIAKKALELLWFIPFGVKVRAIQERGKHSLLYLRRGTTYPPIWRDAREHLLEVARTVSAVLLARHYEYLFVEEQSLCDQLGVTNLHTPQAFAARCLSELNLSPGYEWGDGIIR